MTEIEARLARLENQNRHYRWVTVGATLAAVLLAAFMAIRPAPTEAQATTVTAQRFVLVDAAGREAGVLETDFSGPRLVLLDPSEPDRFARERAQLRLVEGNPLFVLSGAKSLDTENVAGVVRMEAHPEGASVELRSRPGLVLSQLLLMTTPDGAGIIDISDAAGRTLWTAP